MKIMIITLSLIATQALAADFQALRSRLAKWESKPATKTALADKAKLRAQIRAASVAALEPSLGRQPASIGQNELQHLINENSPQTPRN